VGFACDVPKRVYCIYESDDGAQNVKR